MDDAPAVRRRQALGDGQRVIRGLARRERPGVQHLAQRAPLEQLAHQIRRALMHAGIVDGEDVRVIQRRQRPGLLLEAPQAVGVAGELPRQHLDRHVAVEPRVPRAEHLAHAARAEPGGDPVLVEGGADHGFAGINCASIPEHLARQWKASACVKAFRITLRPRLPDDSIHALAHHGPTREQRRPDKRA